MKERKMLLQELLKIKLPAECCLAGDSLVDDLIEDYFSGITDAPEKYKGSDDGFNFDVYELALFIFAGIEAANCLLDIISKIWDTYHQKNMTEDQLICRNEIYRALIQNGISDEDANAYCERHFS